MDRKEFLKRLGLAGMGAALPLHLQSPLRARTNQTGAQNANASSECVLIPSETAGPFPLDLTDNVEFFRQDVREDRIGVKLRLRMRVMGEDNCSPMRNVRVHIWHCDNEGRYSGYDLPSNPGQEGETYLRGYQITDANGEVEFITTFPGWYPGRVCHIHFRVHVSSNYAATSQFTFPEATKQVLYYDHVPEYPNGADPIPIQSDGAFADGYDLQLATLEPSEEGYDSFLEVTVRGAGTAGVGHQERRNATAMRVGQNHPNPFTRQTTIPLELLHPSDVKLRLFDLNGELLHTYSIERQTAGNTTLEVDLDELGLSTGTYVYEVEATNETGTYRECRVMTGAHR